MTTLHAPLLWMDNVTSTQDIVRERFDIDAWPDFAAVAARTQTQGRGTRGTAWLGDDGALALSVLKRVPKPLIVGRWPTLAQRTPLIAGVAVLDALRTLDAPADLFGLKWPNDIMVRTDGDHSGRFGRYRKVGGILVDVLRMDDDACAVAIGIGINIDRSNALRLRAPDACGLADVGVVIDRADVAARVQRALWQWRDAWTDATWNHALDAHRAASILVGQSITYQTGNAQVTGRVVDVSARGHLLVENSGAVTEVSSATIERIGLLPRTP